MKECGHTRTGETHIGHDEWETVCKDCGEGLGYFTKSAPQTGSYERNRIMKYPVCSTCKNKPYQAGLGGPCVTCVPDDDDQTPTVLPTNWSSQP